MAAMGIEHPASAIAKAIAEIFSGVVTLISGNPSRIAGQADAARPDAIVPGMFKDDDKTWILTGAILFFMLLIIGFIIYSASKSK